MAELNISLTQDCKIQYLEGGQVLWERGQENGQPQGLSNARYPHDGTLQRIRAALLEALMQIEGELACADPHITPRARRSRERFFRGKGVIV